MVERFTRRAECQHESLGQGVALDLVRVPGGEFAMGAAAGEGYPDERPQHRVAVASFLLGRYLVTQAQWASVMGEPAVCRCPGPELPVDSTGRDAAAAFCRRLSEVTGRPYRLPTEAEWEYGCRAGTATPFACGATITTDLANFNGEFTYAAEPKGTYRHRSTPGGMFAPNGFGICDMHGNLWEWCADGWHEDYAGAPDDGTAWEPAAPGGWGVLRGGSWHDTPQVCRSATRLRAEAAAGGDDLFGFRVALSLT